MQGRRQFPLSFPTPGLFASLLVAWRQGDSAAGRHLYQGIYDDLRAIARCYMRGERIDHTLQPTALVHETYVRMFDLKLDWVDRAHYLSMAARTMRRILIDHARSYRSAKRGSGVPKIPMADTDEVTLEPSWDLVDLDIALCELRALDERQGLAIELHYFCGLSYDEIAAVMDTSKATVGRQIRHAKAWLRLRLV